MKKLALLIAVLMVTVGCQKKEKEGESTNPTTETTATTIHKYNPNKTVVNWTAFKTPEKVGVNGKFTEFELTGAKESEYMEEVLSNTEFKIQKSSVSTGDVARDATIQAMFFHNLKEDVISGNFGQFQNMIVPTTIVMNGVEKTFDFSYAIVGNEIVVTGVIDILADFQANEAFEALANACAEQHQNKTWSDVTIEMITEL